MGGAGLSNPKLVVLSKTMMGTTDTRCWVLSARFVQLMYIFPVKTTELKKSIKKNKTIIGHGEFSKRSSCRLGAEHAQ